MNFSLENNKVSEGLILIKGALNFLYSVTNILHLGRNKMELTSAKSKQEVSRAFLSCSMLVLILLLLYLGIMQISEKLPYIKPGSDVMYAAKSKYLQNHLIFTVDKPIKVLALGNSKVMSGFIPDQFDHEVPGVVSYNAGFPNATTFKLEEWLKRGNVPTHVLYMIPWRDSLAEKKSLFRFLPSDESIINALFPFHMIVHDVVFFIVHSHKFGGLLASYQYAKKQVTIMHRDRGYYFIEDQSRFSDYRVPDNFHFIDDDASVVKYREANIHTHAFQELKHLADQYGFKIIVMPYYLRKGERGAAGMNHSMIEALRPYNEFHVVGKDYLLLDNHYFSDAAHLNPDGAQLFTHIIANLMREELNSERDHPHAF